VTGTAAQFEGFDTIRFSVGQPVTAVSLGLSEAGVVDLADELLGRRALFAGTAGNDTVTTSNGSDQIDGGAGDDVLTGNAGNDTLIGGLGDDVLSGGEGTDFLVELSGVVSVDGGAGDDVITLGAALNAGTVAGGLGIDQLNKGGTIAGLTVSGIEIVNTNGGTLTASAAQLEGFDTIRFSAAQASTAVTLALSEAGTVDLVDELLGRRALFAGTAGNDTITTSNGSDQIDGGAGDDVLTGNAGVDTLIGGLGDDSLNGGDGGDFLVDLAGIVAIDAGDGDDVLSVGAAVTAGAIAGGLGTGDQLNKSGNLSGITVSGVEIINTNGGTLTATAAQLEGFDTIRFSAAQATAAISLAQASAGTVDLTDEASGRRVIYAGSSGNDVVTLSNGADRLDGGSGDDTLNGGLGNDTVLGGLGTDLIVQGSTDGRDLIDGGAGADTYRLLGTAAAETFRIMTRAEAITAGITGLAGATEIVITRNGTDTGSVIAELDNIEEIEIDALVATANNGNGVVDGGAVGGDTVIVLGNFATTSLDYSTITINGSTASDTVDITGLTSDHRVVFASNGGTDTVVGTPRPQDVFGMSDGISGLVGFLGGLAGSGLAPDFDRFDNHIGRTMIDGVDHFQPLDLVAGVSPLQITADARADIHHGMFDDRSIVAPEVDYVLP
jgi:Ca2+-binding RTX toxin-like protein